MAASGSDDDGPSNFPAAMNQSIYVMVSVPYITLAGVGFLIYRGVRKNAQYLASMQTSPATGPVQT